MRRVVVMLVFGLVALGVQSGLATVLPRQLCPDFGLLVVIAMGLHWQEATRGLFVASALGFAADFLSSSIFGAHALLRVLAYATTALARSQMDLRSGLALGLFVGGVTIFYALGLFSLMGMLGLSLQESWWSGIGGVFPQAMVNAVFAPLVSSIVSRLSEWAEGESSRPGLEIDASRSRS